MTSNQHIFSSKESCAPNADWNGYSCFSKDSLVKLAESCNKQFNTNINLNLEHKELYQNLKENLKDKCSKETCWSNILNQKNIESVSHKPMRPKGNEWLSNFDIEDVLKQYESKYSDFKFISVSPIDFDNIKDKTHQFCPKTQYSFDKTKFGFVFNTDPHYKSGEHWICSFIDLNSKTIEFFDSTSDKPPKQVLIFFDRIKKKCKEDLNLNMQIKINSKSHQLEDNECGVYCLNYIIRRILGDSFEKITGDIKRDKDMYKNRDVYFRTFKGGKSKLKRSKAKTKHNKTKRKLNKLHSKAKHSKAKHSKAKRKLNKLHSKAKPSKAKHNHKPSKAKHSKDKHKNQRRASSKKKHVTKRNYRRASSKKISKTKVKDLAQKFIDNPRYLVY